jgi:hypothetical protein
MAAVKVFTFSGVGPPLVRWRMVPSRETMIRLATFGWRPIAVLVAPLQSMSRSCFVGFPDAFSDHVLHEFRCAGCVCDPVNGGAIFVGSEHSRPLIRLPPPMARSAREMTVMVFEGKAITCFFSCWSSSSMRAGTFASPAVLSGQAECQQGAVNRGGQQSANVAGEDGLK